MSLSDVTAGPVIKPRRLFLYGPPAIGKSTFAASIPDGIFIPCEDGINDLDTIRFPLAQSFSEVLDRLRELATEEHIYTTVIIDTMDALERLVWQEVCDEFGKGSIEDFGYAKGFIYALKHWDKLMQALDYLRDNKGMHIVLLAHSLIKPFSPPDGDTYNMYRPRIHEKAWHSITAWADEVGFANMVTRVKETKDGKKQGITAGERLIHWDTNAAYLAKCRLDLPPTTPLSWQAYSEHFYKEI